MRSFVNLSLLPWVFICWAHWPSATAVAIQAGFAIDECRVEVAIALKRRAEALAPSETDRF